MRQTPLTEALEERDAALSRAEAAEKDRDMYLRLSNEETEAKVAFRGERDAALARAETAEKERDEWERSHGDVVEVIGAIAGALQVARGGSDSFEDWSRRITPALAELRAQLEAVTAERDDLAQKLSSNWIEREVDARVMSEFSERSGPVAFERNQLRDELAELRPKVDDLRSKLAAAEHRAFKHERDADESARAVAVLSTIIRASVEAIARGVK